MSYKVILINEKLLSVFRVARFKLYEFTISKLLRIKLILLNGTRVLASDVSKITVIFCSLYLDMDYIFLISSSSLTYIAIANYVVSSLFVKHM